jgi:Zn-finger nucleic acid-binding protein
MRTNELAIEARYPCPVCLGATMKKVRLKGSGRTLVLDYCPRCGGVWFELGEVQSLRTHMEASFWSTVAPRADQFRMPCHSCQAMIDRNADKCAACGWTNRIDCPTCGKKLAPEIHEGLRLDVCAKCKGVWFDHIELDAIWKSALNANVARGTGPSRRGVAADVGGEVLLNTLFFAPDVLFYGAHAAGMALETGAGAVMNAPEVVGGAAEALGDAAASTFDSVLEILGGIFDF